MLRIGIIREGKTPPDHRVPLTPQQCKLLKEVYSELDIVVQSSDVRAFKDEEYEAQGVEVRKDMGHCDVLMGVKEVPLEMLIPDKTYLFFSHTYKKQAYNRNLLQTILDKKIRLIDYEMLKEPTGKRLLGFGRYAGIVGAYNAMRAWGEMTGDYHLKPAHECEDRREMERELIKVKLPPTAKVLITGAGRVAGGAMEVLSALRFTHVFPKEYINQEFKEPVFTQLNEQQYYERVDGKDFTRQDFYKDPSGFRSRFMHYARNTDIYIPCHFWSNKSPYVFSREDARSPDFGVKLVSDISCDIDGPVASTLRPSTIEDPFYGYDPRTEKEVPFGTLGSIGVSAVDNLPCELPKDASEDFGNELIKNVIPHFFNGDNQGVLEAASETNQEGQLTPAFSYLEDYVRG
ncbi:MAG: NAD(P)-dependent oxidoreductase [Owenweeksia sp.]